ncbi:MAG: hypothetical protein LBT20_07255 [Clostridiales bacterium]|jgi:hypothetical protein|nr:hypothetical protein [Clostridiales bacterium]
MLCIFPVKEHILKYNGRILCADGMTETITVGDGDSVFEILPLRPCQGRFYTAFAVVLTVKNGEPERVTEGASICRVCDRYEIVFTPQAIFPRLAETVPAEAEYTAQNRRFLLKIVDDGMKYLIAEADSPRTLLFREPLPPCLSAEKITVATEGNSLSIRITGKIDEKEYLMILDVRQSGIKILFEECADEIEIAPREIRTATRFYDMRGRTRVKYYTVEGSLITEMRQEYKYGADIAYPTELLPYLFLEALGANDADCLKSYLAPDLCADLDGLYEYFGEFRSVEYPTSGRFPLSTVALRYHDGDKTRVEYVSFVIENGLILNFEKEAM